MRNWKCNMDGLLHQNGETLRKVWAKIIRIDKIEEKKYNLMVMLLYTHLRASNVNKSIFNRTKSISIFYILQNWLNWKPSQKWYLHAVCMAFVFSFHTKRVSKFTIRYICCRPINSLIQQQPTVFGFFLFIYLFIADRKKNRMKYKFNVDAIDIYIPIHAGTRNIKHFLSPISLSNPKGEKSVQIII